MTTTYEYQGQAGGLYELKLTDLHKADAWGKSVYGYEFWYDGVMLIAGKDLAGFGESEGRQLAADCINLLTSDNGEGKVLYLDSDGAEDDMDCWVVELEEPK